MLTILFEAAKIVPMQSNKASKKTRQIADETTSPAAENAVAGETAAKPRSSKSSKPKSETGESTSAKRHHKAAAPEIAISNSSETASSSAAGTAFGVAVETSRVTSSLAIDPVGVLAPPTPAVDIHAIDHSAEENIGSDDIARLAHSYWLERGGPHGSSEEDWLRAERDLLSRR